MLILKIVQKSSFSGITTQEVYTEFSDQACIMKLNHSDSADLPESWGDSYCHPDIVWLVQDGSKRFSIYKEDDAYLLSQNGDTIRVIHRS